MIGMFLAALESEWLKKKRSLASRMILIGASFTPVIIVAARILRFSHLKVIYADSLFWSKLWVSSWESMAIFFLPLGATLFTALITQLEYKNNGWKQLHTLPLSYTSIYFSKLMIILIMMSQFILLFNAGFILSGLIPALLGQVHIYPITRQQFLNFLSDDWVYYISVIPIIALQYTISLLNKNFLVSVGTGFILWVAALSVLSTNYNMAFPYAHIILQYLHSTGKGQVKTTSTTLMALSLCWTLVFISAGYIFYRFKKEKC